MIPDYINLTFSLEFGQCNGSMSIDILDDTQRLVFLENVAEKSLDFNYNIMLPNKIRFNLANKNTNRDTKVDKQGNVIADKYVRLASMSLGGIPIKPVTLFKICRYTTNDQMKFDTYWGFNGTIEIDFCEDNFIKWHLKSDNLFDL
jgi:hypothetical protein